MSARKPHGFTLVELMIAMVLGLIIIGGVTAMFLSTHQTSRTNDALSRVQETGRFAIQRISREIREAGFRGCQGGNINMLLDTNHPDFDENVHDVHQPLLPPARASEGNQNHAFTIHRMRFVAEARAKLGSPGASSPPIPLESTVPVEKGDIVMVEDPRGRCEIFKRVNASNANNLNRSPGSVGNPPHNIGPASGAFYTDFDGPVNLFGLQSSTFFVADSQMNPGIRSLYRRDEQDGRVDEIAQGVSGLRVEYGRDTTGDFELDSFSSADDTAGWTADEWGQVVALRLHLLVNNGPENNVVDQPQQGIRFGGIAFDAPDRRLYRVFRTTIALRNRLN